MRLRKLCSVLIILLLSAPAKPIHASSNPRIIATYLNWDIALFYDQNVKSCVAISKGTYYTPKEEIIVEEEVVEDETPIIAPPTPENDIAEKPINIGIYDFGVDGNPQTKEDDSAIYDFGRFDDEVITLFAGDKDEAVTEIPSEEELGTRAEEKLFDSPDGNPNNQQAISDAKQETLYVDGEFNIIPQTRKRGPIYIDDDFTAIPQANNYVDDELNIIPEAKQTEEEEEVEQEAIFLDNDLKIIPETEEIITDIDTEKLLAEAQEKYEAQQDAIPKNIQKGAFFITNWPKRNEYFEISVRPEALLQHGTEAVLIFPDDKNYALTQSKLDAKPNPYLRVEILNHLRQHRFAEVINYNKNGKEMRYYYDLQGIDHALSALIKFCPLPHAPNNLFSE
ncbi:MAG: hypothetical protein K0U39_02030 [Alphaproteobacteria bacterium]|nr:hypothetical protein [Alphaproteobacteria bacterium]